jgi:protein tyrosine/serine phosphatase
MRTIIHWIEAALPGRLAIMPRPRGGDWLDDEVIGWKAEGIDLVASLLEPGEVIELELDREASLCTVHAIEFVSFPIADRGVPSSLLEAAALARLLAFRISEGKSTAIHCRAGIGRSSIVAACVMVCLGTTPEKALEKIAIARGLNVPDTADQQRWVRAFADWWTSGPLRV